MKAEPKVACDGHAVFANHGHTGAAIYAERGAHDRRTSRVLEMDKVANYEIKLLWTALTSRSLGFRKLDLLINERLLVSLVSGLRVDLESLKARVS